MREKVVEMCHQRNTRHRFSVFQVKSIYRALTGASSQREGRENTYMHRTDWPLSAGSHIHGGVVHAVIHIVE